MCFSAGASFGISAVLMAGGISAVRKASVQSQLPFAFIPIIFSMQQFIEGILWMSLTNPIYENWQQVSTYTFLIIAQVAWPVWVPVSMVLLEKDLKRKKMLVRLTGLGCIVSLCLAYSLLNYRIISGISSHHISYGIAYPYSYMRSFSIFYFIPTAIPFFISSVKKMSIIGSILLVSFIIAKLFFGEYVISVWCFFAASISIAILLIMSSFKASSEKLNNLMAK